MIKLIFLKKYTPNNDIYSKIWLTSYQFDIVVKNKTIVPNYHEHIDIIQNWFNSLMMSEEGMGSIGNADIC